MRLTKGHIADDWQSRDWSPALAVPKVCPFDLRMTLPVVSQGLSALSLWINRYCNVLCYLKKGQTAGEAKSLRFGEESTDNAWTVINDKCSLPPNQRLCLLPPPHPLPFLPPLRA